MACADQNNFDEETNFIHDFWIMIKKFWIPEDNDTYWAELTQYADQLWKKYERSYFVQKMVVAYCDYLDQKYRKGLK